MSAGAQTHAYARPEPSRTGGAVVAGAVLASLVALSVLSPWLPLADPAATALAQRLLSPGEAGHWLGTDHLGRDVLSRLLFGTRASLAVALLGTVAAGALGTLAGLLSGYRGGRTDTWLMRGMDVLLAFPYVLLALALVAALGPGLRNASLAVAAVNVPFFARSVRGGTLALARQEFVEVARLSGQSEARILTRELLPNLLPIVVVASATTAGWMILETAGLSFLGLGAQPPDADLGSMLGQGRRFLSLAPHLALVPGAMILALTACVHTLGDALRDRLDPQRAARPPEDGPATPRGDAAPARTPADTSGAPPLLVVRRLSVKLPDAGRVVDDVSFSLSAGEAVGLVGESGSGKTLTALSLLGVPPAGARVETQALRLRDLDLAAQDDAGWRSLRGPALAYVPQDPGASLNPLLTVGAHLAETLRAHPGPAHGRAEAGRERAVALLQRVRLPDAHRRLDAYPHQLSGGERQRVLIALALAHEPELLVADEPTTALDVTVQAGILALLSELRRERGSTLLLISHDLGVVAELCDRVLVMQRGRLVEEGPVDRVLARPQARYTRELLDAVPRLGEARRVLEPAGGAE